MDCEAYSVSFSVVVTFLSLVGLLIWRDGKDSHRMNGVIDELERPRCVAGLTHHGRKKKMRQFTGRNRELEDREGGKGGAAGSEVTS